MNKAGDHLKAAALMARVIAGYTARMVAFLLLGRPEPIVVNLAATTFGNPSTGR